jgi:hypothetical protein
MRKLVTRRTAKAAKKNTGAKATPNKLDVLTVLLQNIYWNGFKDHRGVSYRIRRSRLRGLADVQRLEAGTMNRLVKRVRADGFILYPMDKSDYARAKEWIFDRLDNLAKRPLADDAAISNAEERSEHV